MRFGNLGISRTDLLTIPCKGERRENFIAELMYGGIVGVSDISASFGGFLSSAWCAMVCLACLRDRCQQEDDQTLDHVDIHRPPEMFQSLGLLVADLPQEGSLGINSQGQKS